MTLSADNQSYTAMWTNDLCRELIREGYAGRQPMVLFGGPHSSLPSFQRMAVRPGDTIYPIRAYQARLHPLCAVRVERVIPLKEAEEHLTDQQRAWVHHWSMLRRSCVSEIVLAKASTPLDFSRHISSDTLERLTYTARRGDRKVKHVEDGKLLYASSIQGIFRLHQNSAAEFRDLVGEPDALLPTAQTPLRIAAYLPYAPMAFTRLHRKLSHLADVDVERIDHVGSTAVPGLAGQPVIDIDLVVRSQEVLPTVVASLQAGGYRLIPTGLAGCAHLTAPLDDTPQCVRIHVAGEQRPIDNLAVRDALRADPLLAQEYAALKLSFAREAPDDHDGYKKAKAHFLRTVPATAP